MTPTARGASSHFEACGASSLAGHDQPINETKSNYQPPTANSHPIGIWGLGFGIWGFVMDLTFGARLRSQRESQHLALAAIAEETKINLALLEGLERDDLSRWPGGLFRRAYVRIYAQKIGLDPERVVREFSELYPDPVAAASPVEALAQNSEGKRPKTRIGLMIAGLAGLRPQRREVQRRDVQGVVTPETFAMEERRSGVPGDQDEPPVSVPEPIVETPALVELDLGALAEIDAPAPRLVVIPSPDANGDTRRDVRRFERDVAATARLCTRIASAQDQGDLACALDETVEMLGAHGAILWAWDPYRDVLFPVLAHGYPDDLLARLPEVRRCADNAIANGTPLRPEAGRWRRRRGHRSICFAAVDAWRVYWCPRAGVCERS